MQPKDMNGSVLNDRNRQRDEIDDEEIIASTAAARVNGYLNGCGTVEARQEELDSLGLSSEASEELLEIVHRY
jgi:peptide-methionine (S)-S-oxide reductase